MCHLNRSRDDADNTHSEVRRLREEGGQMLRDIADFKRDLDRARMMCLRQKALVDEIDTLRSARLSPSSF